MRMRYTAVAFDFFGVLCSHVAPRWLAEHCGPERIGEVREQVLNKVDSGEISQGEMFERLAGVAGLQTGVVEEQWYALAIVDPEMTTMLRELRPSVKLALLSNASWPFVRSLLRHADIEKLFDCIIISSECRHTKPAPAIYNVLLDVLGELAATVIFVDDAVENVRGATNVGITGIQFQSPRHLRTVLEDMAVL